MERDEEEGSLKVESRHEEPYIEEFVVFFTNRNTTRC